MKFAIVLAALCLSGGCSAPNPQSPTALMDAIERQVKLPKAAAPLEKYARFYAQGSSGEVVGLYIVPTPRPPGTICSEGGKRIACNTLPVPDWKKVPPAERRWLGERANLPTISDGGCGVINVVYRPASNSVETVACNGPE